MDEDIFVDDIIKNKKSKKINCSRKGKARERELCKILTKRFEMPFSRTIGSGNRWSQASLSAAAIQVFSGDLVTPENFVFTIESKGGYDDVDLVSVFDGGHSQIDEFIEQAQFDADRCGRKPMVVWKKNRKPIVALLKTVDIPHQNWEYRLFYRDWSMVNFDELLKVGNIFWFRSDTH